MSTISSDPHSSEQISWAERIKRNVNAEFDRVANALRTAAAGQQEQDRADTLDIVAVLEEIRRDTFANGDTGYFIRVWQETGDQVRQLLRQDARYQSIHARRLARRPAAASIPGGSQRAL